MAKFDENYFKFDNSDEKITIDSMLESGEQKLWCGKPNKTAFLLSSIFKMLPVAIIWIIFDSAMITMLALNFSDIPTMFKIFICVFFVVHLIPVWMWIYNVVTASKRHENIEYVFTDKRIIIKSGLLGIDVQNIYYSDIQSVNVKVNWIDKKLKVGDIYIKSTSSAQVLWDIPSPYGITNRLQKIVLDIKSDINFPNALRPDENNGYNTTYKG